MALWVCEGCTTKYAVGLVRCPRCHSTDFHEDGTMPKISKAAGATNGVDEPAPEPEAVVPATEVEASAAAVASAEEVEVDPFADPFAKAEAEPEAGADADAEPALAEEPIDTEAMTVVQLRDECDRRGLPKTGTKAELLDRLEENPETAE